MTGDKVRKANLDAGYAVIGAMLIDSACVGPTLAETSEENFVLTELRLIYQTIKQQFQEGKPVDGVTIAERVALAGENLRDFIAQVIEITPTSANVSEYIALLRESSALYRLRQIGEKIQAAETLEDAGRLLDQAREIQVKRPGVRRMDYTEGLTRFLDRHSKEKIEIMPWAIPRFADAVTVERGDVVILGAYPGAGKTAFALQQAAAVGQKYPVGYYVHESTGDRLYDRHVSQTALIDADRITQNKLTEADWAELAELSANKILQRPQVHLIDAAGMSAGDIVNDALAHHYPAIVVDYAQKVAGSAPPGRWETEYQRVTGVSNTLQEFAARTGTTVYLLSQLTRPAKVTQKSGGKSKTITPPPSLSSLRSSGQLEQDADVVLLMWVEDEQEPEGPRIIHVAKNRHGRPGAYMRLAFDGAHQTFRRIEPREAPRKKAADPVPARVDFWADGGAYGDVLDSIDESNLPF